MQNEIALVNQNNQAFVSSRELAVKFSKQHKDVLRIIRGYLDSENMNDFNERNFALNKHIQVGRAKRGRPRLSDVLMTRDGFALLAMGLTGKRALEWKVKFLDAFNQMERVIVEKVPALQAENAALKAALEKKALPGRRANQIAVPVYHENLFGLVEEIRYEMRNKEKLDELMRAKAIVRHLRKQMKGMIAKQDQLAERIDLLEGNKKAKLIKLIKDDPEKPL